MREYARLAPGGNALLPGLLRQKHSGTSDAAAASLPKSSRPSPAALHWCRHGGGPGSAEAGTHVPPSGGSRVRLPSVPDAGDHRAQTVLGAGGHFRSGG
ncbi:hypothetical protein GCM10026982_10750 [Nocardiopsis aegyptia]